MNDVRDKLIEFGVQDEIRFHFVKMDPEKIRGMLHRYTKHNSAYGDPVLCSEIIISEDMGHENKYWQRLVAVKELVHIIDSPEMRADHQTEVDTLIKNFSIPPEIRNNKNSGTIKTKPYLNDRMGIFIALAILVPAECRKILRSLYNVSLSSLEIADIAKIPERYISIVMDEEFDQIVETFISLN